MPPEQHEGVCGRHSELICSYCNNFHCDTYYMTSPNRANHEMVYRNWCFTEHHGTNDDNLVTAEIQCAGCGRGFDVAYYGIDQARETRALHQQRCTDFQHILNQTQTELDRIDNNATKAILIKGGFSTHEAKAIIDAILQLLIQSKT